MESLTRVKLITVYKNSVISNGFGSLIGKVRVGKVINSNNRVVFVNFKDRDGDYVEKYTINNGTRVDDLGDSSGWRIRTTDWTEKEGENILPIKCNDKSKKGGLRFTKLLKEIYPLDKIDGNTHELLIEVWKDNEIGGIYLRSYRELTIEGKLRKKQTPALVPMTVLIKVMGEIKLLERKK